MHVTLLNKWYTLKSESGFSFRLAYGESDDIAPVLSTQPCTYTGSAEASVFNAYTTAGVPMGTTGGAGRKSLASGYKVSESSIYLGNVNTPGVTGYYRDSVASANYLGRAGFISGTLPQISIPLVVKNTVSGDIYTAALLIQLSSGAWLSLYDAYMSVIAPSGPSADAPGYAVIDGELWSHVTGLGNDIMIAGAYSNTYFTEFIEEYTPIGPSTDPYDPGGSSDTGGGTGNFDDTSVPVDIPSLPSLSALDTGFIALYNPSLSELLALASYMWSTGFDLDTLKKLFADPMDCILGLSIVPVAVPDGGQSAVKVGNISTGVMMNKASSQYVTVDCGSLAVNEYWGGYLDYAPFTQAEIYLPYIGTHPLALDDIMGKTVHVVYHVDILSGACCAYVQCDGTVLYSFIGQCSSSIPVTGNDFTSVINGVLSIAGSIGTMIATGGASAPMAAGTIASNAVNSLKPQVEKSGAMSGTGGLLGIQVPYIILTRPRQALPAGQNALMGYPSFITRTLGSLSGYTEVESIHLEGIPCTSEELTEIETLLQGGVIL